MPNYKRALELQEQTIADRRWLHQHPEIGHDLPQTAAYVKKRLTEMGYVPEEVGNSGITASVGGKKGGKVILLRADMDALPIEEKSELEFSATNGSCHACGHDLHTSSLLCAAQILKEQEDSLEGTVKLLFQPAEEFLSGASAMIDAGILKNTPVPDVAFSAHVASTAPTGVVAYRAGAIMASSDSWEITISGSGGHGSTPELCVDPINIGVHIHLALQELISREISFTDSAVLTVGEFRGGTAPNIIPETAQLRGTLRTLDEKTRQFLLKRIKEVVESVATVYRGTAEFAIKEAAPVTFNNEDLMGEVKGYLETVADGKLYLAEIPPVAGSEDFAYIAQEIPSVYVMLGAQPPEVKKPYPQHHEKVVFDENELPIAATSYATVAINWLKNNK